MLIISVETMKTIDEKEMQKTTRGDITKSERTKGNKGNI